jgi:hypothetical protein
MGESRNTHTVLLLKLISTEHLEYYDSDRMANGLEINSCEIDYSDMLKLFFLNKHRHSIYIYHRPKTAFYMF